MKITYTLGVRAKPETEFFGSGVLFLSVVFLVLERFELIKEISTFLSAIMFVVVIIYLVKNFKKSREHMLTYFYQIYYFIGAMLSAILIGSGVHMIEIQKVGNANGIFWALVIFFIAGLKVSQFAYYWSQRRVTCTRSPNLGRRREKIIVISILSISLLLSLYVLFRYSSPYLLHIDRVNFWRSIVPQGLSFIPNLIQQTFFLAVAFYWSIRDEKIEKKLARLLIWLYLAVTVVVLGQKFSTFIIYATVFLFFISAHKPNFRLSNKVLARAFFGITVIYFLLSFGYSSIDRGDSFIFIRTALQSQLIWSVFDSPDFSWLGDAPSICFWGCGDAPTGIIFITFKYLSLSLFEFYKEGGTVLSGFMPALPILTFGIPIAFLLHIAFSFFGGITQAYLVEQLKRRNIIFGFFIFKINFALVMFWYAAMHSAIFGVGFAILFAIFLMFLILIPHRRYYRDVSKINAHVVFK